MTSFKASSSALLYCLPSVSLAISSVIPVKLIIFDKLNYLKFLAESQAPEFLDDLFQQQCPLLRGEAWQCWDDWGLAESPLPSAPAPHPTLSHGDTKVLAQQLGLRRRKSEICIWKNPSLRGATCCEEIFGIRGVTPYYQVVAYSQCHKTSPILYKNYCVINSPDITRKVLIACSCAKTKMKTNTKKTRLNLQSGMKNKYFSSLRFFQD